MAPSQTRPARGASELRGPGQARRLPIVVAVTCAYGASFPLLYGRLGDRATALVMVPVLVSALLFGVRGAVTLSVAAVPLNMLLHQLAGGGATIVVSQPFHVVGLAGTLVLGATVGLLRDLSARLRLEVARRSQAQELLRLANAQLEARVEEQTSELRRANEALSAGEESLRTTLDSIGDAVIATDVEARVVRINPAAEQLTGWPAPEAVGRRLDEVFRIINEDSRQPTVAPAQRVLREGVVVGLANHTALIGRDGSERPIADSGAPIRDPSGRITGVVLVFRDMTEERRAERVLREADAQFRLLTDHASDLVFISSAGGAYQYVSPSSGRLVGYAPAELVGQPIAGFLHPEDRAGVLRRLGEAGPDQSIWTYRHRRRDGGYALLESSSRAVHGKSDGSAAKIICIARDITEREAMRAKLLIADRMTSLGTLASGVAHEINNPLSYVIANLRYARDELGALSRPGTPATVSAEQLADLGEVLSEAAEGADRVRFIVRDLKAFSRAEDEKLEQIDVRQSLETALSMTRNELRHRARVVKEFGPVARVKANQARIGQVFLNLLVNAAQAIPAGAADRNEVRVVTRTAPDGGVVVEVHDTGSGIAPEIRGRLFDPFFTTKAIGVGTGLGLSICHGIVTALGGEIAVESEVGRGSTFRVTLPGSNEEPEQSPPEAAPAAPARKGRILVVDDEPMVLLAIQRALGGEHEVDVLTTAQEALRLIAGGDRYDVIVCDVMMPSMTGMDLHAELARIAPGQRDRMVFISGGVFSSVARAFLEQVPNVRIDKPFDPDQLRALVRRQVG